MWGEILENVGNKHKTFEANQNLGRRKKKAKTNKQNNKRIRKQNKKKTILKTYSFFKIIFYLLQYCMETKTCIF